MPENLRTSNKIRVVSGPLHAALPRKISAFDEQEEKHLIECMMAEINENYAANADEQPVLARSSGSEGPSSGKNGCKIVIVGVSHAKRIAGGLASSNHDVLIFHGRDGLRIRLQLMTLPKN
jgi:hypothetical protein